MKKLLEQLKNNKTLLIILALVIVLILIVVFYNDTSGDASAGSFNDKTQTEIKLEGILSSIDGVGESNVMVTESADGIEGVIIVCQGADNIMTRNDILNAVSTALNIEKNIIAIYAMN